MKELYEPILVTGAGGFIGSHLTEALTGSGYHVRAMVHYNFQNSLGWLEEVLGDRIEHPSRKTSPGGTITRFLLKADFGNCILLSKDCPLPISAKGRFG